MKNFFSVDLEEWYASKVFPGFKPDYGKDYVVESTKPLLNLLDKHNIKATFFVLGTVLENHPLLIEKIHKKGHEIAFHGYSHKKLTELTPKQFDLEVKKSIKLIKKITGKKPIGFRAPNFSLNKKTSWALDVLCKNGYKYDSSLFPYKSQYYGEENVPRQPFNLKNNNCLNSKANMIEFPLTMVKIAKIPFIINGGFYLRLYPSSFVSTVIRHMNNVQNRPANIYIHPWEIYSGTPRVKTNSVFGNFVSNHNAKNGWRKLDYLFKRFEFTSFKEYLDSQ